MKIMYLDEKKKRAVTKALSRHGRVFHAASVGDALPLLLENDFDYYFVDADTPQAQAFLGHLEHDPHLVDPRAVVLLTNNEDEDCSAWRVDTFITHGRIGQDVPYVFSHLRGEAAEPTKVFAIVPGNGVGAEDARGRLRAFEGHPTGGRAGGNVYRLVHGGTPTVWTGRMLKEVSVQGERRTLTATNGQSERGLLPLMGATGQAGFYYWRRCRW